MVALNKIIEFIVKYQNSYVFSFLFDGLLIKLLNKGIKVTQLFESDIFCHSFEYDDWPVVHSAEDSLIVPYNNSIFSLSGSYKQVFNMIPDENEDTDNKADLKFFKIKYTLNLLPSVTYDGEECIGLSDLMEAIGDTNEDSIFDTKIVQDFYDY